MIFWIAGTDSEPKLADAVACWSPVCELSASVLLAVFSSFVLDVYVWFKMSKSACRKALQAINCKCGESNGREGFTRERGEGRGSWSSRKHRNHKWHNIGTVWWKDEGEEGGNESEPIGNRGEVRVGVVGVVGEVGKDGTEVGEVIGEVGVLFTRIEVPNKNKVSTKGFST